MIFPSELSPAFGEMDEGIHDILGIVYPVRENNPQLKEMIEQRSAAYEKACESDPALKEFMNSWRHRSRFYSG